MSDRGRNVLYYRTAPESDRWVRGDRHWRPIVRRIVRGRPRLGGVEKVFTNLCLGLDRSGIDYEINLPFEQLEADDRVGVLGRGRYSLQGYTRPNPIVAGIGVMTNPSDWPTLCDEFPIAKYLQHSKWAADRYLPYFGARCAIWPVGIDTDAWAPSAEAKDFGFLVYDKLNARREYYETELLNPIRTALSVRQIPFQEIRYGGYNEAEYRALLGRASAMIFLSEHESQGLAYQECLSSGVPVLAWDQGIYYGDDRCDPNLPEVHPTSVPYFDESCGERFRGRGDLDGALDKFLDRLHKNEFDPRTFILNTLGLEECSRRFIEILRDGS